MKMNKSKQYYRVSFNCNLDAGNIRYIDVWASTPTKALKLANELIRKDPDVFSYQQIGIMAVKESLA